MKKYFWGILALAAVWMIPRLSHPAVDIGKLEPVETMLLTVEEQGISIKTDTGAEGYGVTLEGAVTAVMIHVVVIGLIVWWGTRRKTVPTNVWAAEI